MSIDPRTFRNALGCFATGVTVITGVKPDDTPVGVTVSSFSSLSLDPPLVLFSLGKRTTSMEAYTKGTHFVVNILEESQRELSIRFASRQHDKFAGVDFETWESGCPILAGALAQLECRKTASYDGGDHLIFVGEVENLHYRQGGQPLLYFRGSYTSLNDADI